MPEKNPFKGVPKTKIIIGEEYKLYDHCFGSIGILQAELNYLRDAGYSAYKHKKGNWYFIYLRKGR